MAVWINGSLGDGRSGSTTTFLLCFYFSVFLSFIIALLPSAPKRFFRGKTSAFLHRPVLFCAGKQGVIEISTVQKSRGFAKSGPANLAKPTVVESGNLTEMQRIAGTAEV